MPENDAVLAWQFRADGGTAEGTVARGDSGGGVFARDGATWKLIAVNFAASSAYSRNADGSGVFTASLFDGRGFYQPAGGLWVPVETAGGAAPGLSFATRVSPHVAQIRSILAGRERASETSPPGRRRLIAAAAGAAVALIVAALYAARRWRRGRISGADSGR